MSKKQRKQPTSLTPARRRMRLIGVGVALAALVALVVGAVAYAVILRDLPDPGVGPRGRDQTSVVYDRTGAEIVKLFAEENRTDRTLEEIPVALRQAVLATEDQRFYEHRGVDPLGILRALWVDLRTDAVHGGSTITQQYVKNAFVTPERTLKRKLMEALLAYRLEKRYSKDEVLVLYLNTIYFGHGAYGVESASQVYFGEPVTDLTPAECATIAGVIKSPGRYSPYLDPEAGVNRRNTVLAQMESEGYLTAEDRAAAEAEPLVVVGLSDTSAAAPYFIEYVKAQLVEQFGADLVYRGGIRVKTTLNLAMQRAAEQAVTDALDRPDDPSAALVALDPNTGEILAMVGGRDFGSQQFNVAVQGRRQPGSAFKPFVLATALSEGVSPEATFESGAASFALPNGQTWKVTGASGGRTGPMRLREATEKSVNSVFAKLIMDVGAEDVVETGEKLGLRPGIMAVPAIALGGLEDGVSPLEMATAYGTLAAGGTRSEPYAIAEVLESSGKTLLVTEPARAEAIDPAVAYLTTDILKGAIARGTGKSASIGRPAAGKTGTTQEYRDAWFVGYTPGLVTAVWVGYPDAQREMKSVHGRAVTGGSFPAQIWASFMKAALAEAPKDDFVRPKGLQNIQVCTQTGLAATDWCESTFSGLFLAGSSLPDSCDVHTGPIKIEIPSFVGMSKEAALAEIARLMLLSDVKEEDVRGVPTGIVARQDPAAGSIGTTQTVVTLTVSRGTSANHPPVASFVFGPPEPAVGQDVAFNAARSSDDGSIAGYFWEFGDGTEADGCNVTHAFGAPGEFEVTLWVTDDSDQTSSITQVILVR